MKTALLALAVILAATRSYTSRGGSSTPMAPSWVARGASHAAAGTDFTWPIANRQFGRFMFTVFAP